ncbi:hypothetical protein like AT3G25270 [Hibiscus trionum]|uniref:RNase H type-1 domain-containing protein n=1 Tax=Hibiscus trionum TaxID=183268 RepID=A0A9W7ISD8_HIBTR|nr:hypothetical protein like AT3G25270 [Hibiscus trionum]
MRIVCWKFIRNFVPTKVNLCIKKVAGDPICNRCYLFLEDVVHVLCECSYASQIWLALQIREPSNASSLSFQDWLYQMFNINGLQHIQTIIIAVYAIWHARNKLVFEGIAIRIEESIAFIRSYCLDLNLTQSRLSSEDIIGPSRWIAPLDLFLKLNVDAGFDPSTKTAYVGVIIRNKSGAIMGAMCARRERILSSFAAEACAMVQGLRFAMELGFADIIAEGDSLTVIKKLNSKSRDLFEISTYIGDAKSLARRFHTCRFVFTRREGNRSAHAMTLESRKYAEEMFWVEDAPGSVQSIANEDRRWLDPP